MESFRSGRFVAIEKGKSTAEQESPLRDCGQRSISSALLIRGILLVLLFNMCLVTILLGGYVYLSSLTLEQQNYLTNAAFVVVGGVAFVTLLLIGDLSKDRPNFYYI